MTNREQLIQLMDQYQLHCPAVARILDVKSNTVRVWRTANAAQIPDTKLELLKEKLNHIK